jgi:hypothetical protein
MKHFSKLVLAVRIVLVMIMALATGVLQLSGRSGAEGDDPHPSLQAAAASLFTDGSGYAVPGALGSVQSYQMELTGVAPAKNPKLDSHLGRLWAAEHTANVLGQRITAGRLDLLPEDLKGAVAAKLMRVDSAGSVQVFIAAEGDPELAAAHAVALGGTVERVDPPSGIVQARVPISQLEALAADLTVRFIRLPDYPVLDTGSVTSQGDAILSAATTRATFGVDGTGVRVGVVSDGMEGLAASQASGDLPPSVNLTTCNVVPQSPTAAGAGAEGTAMLEIVHDLAPGAELWFGHFGFGFTGTSLDFQAAVNCLAANVDVVVDDIGFLNNGLYDGSSPVSMNASNALNNPANRERTHVNAVGNEAISHYQEPYVDFDAAGTSRLHRFAGTLNTTDVCGLGPLPYDPVLLPPGGIVVVFLQWDDGFGTSGNDYDLYLGHAGNIVAGSENFQDGNDNPTEAVGLINNGSATLQIDILINLYVGVAKTFDMFVLGNALLVGPPGCPGGPAVHNYNTPGSSVTNNSDAGGGVISLGAINASDPGNDTIAFYSSRGPTNDGRLKPDASAIDGISVTGNGGFPSSFFGTSAAAPHGGAIAALVLSCVPSLKFGEPGDNPAADRTALRNALLNSAVDLGAAGADNTFGFGRLNSVAAATAAGCSDGPPTPSITGSSPPSPANENNPEIIGSAIAGSTVGLFTNAGCSGAPVVAGSAATFASPGLTVTVPDNSATTFYANATVGSNTSGCSSGFTYVENSGAPTTPSITGSGPPSPANENNPEIFGSAVAGSTVRLFTSAGCSGTPAVTGSAATFASPGLTVSVPDNSSTTFYANVTIGTDASACSSGFTYVEDSAPPATPSITGSSPAPPANDNSPEIRGSAETGSTVKLFTDTGCSGTPVATGSAASFASPGLTVSVPDNSSTSFYANAMDGAGNTSSCSSGFTYVEETPPPGTPEIFSGPLPGCLGDFCSSGSISFTVAADRTHVSHYRIRVGDPLGVCSFDLSDLLDPSAIPIVDGAFSLHEENSFFILDWQGTFVDVGFAQGTLHARAASGQCSQQPTVSWTATSPLYSPGYYHPVTPCRILDTRPGEAAAGPKGKVLPNSEITVDVTGSCGVPSSAVSAVVINTTVTEPTANSFLTVYPSGVSRPLASNLNFSTGQTVPNLATVKVGTDGNVRVYNAAGQTHVIFDVVGWYGGPTGGSRFNALPPFRVLDTRPGQPAPGPKTPVGPNGTIMVDVTGVAGSLVPSSGVSAVVLNATVTGPTSGSFLTVFPSDASLPLASNLNFGAGQTVPNLVTVKVGADGNVKVYNAAGSTHVIFDVVGWYGATGDLFHPLTPCRNLDTRPGPEPGPKGKVPPNTSINVDVTGRCGVPASEASSVIVNTTVAEPTDFSYLTVYPSDVAQTPLASNLNFGPGQTVPNLVIVRTGPDGNVKAYNNRGHVHVIMDTVGYFGP